MIKTKLALCATVLAAVLFWSGCASTVETFGLSNLVEKDGVFTHKDTGKPVTGMITGIRTDDSPSANSKGDRFEFNVENGIKHGRARRWYLRGGGTEWNAHDAVFEKGELVRYKRWWDYDAQSKSPQLGLKVWKGSSSPWQLMKAGWNQDGTPTKEKALELNASSQTYNITHTVEQNGFFYHEGTNKPVTGRIVKMMEGEFKIIFHVKHGVKDGVFKQWHSTDNIAQDSLYKAGVLIRHKVFTTSESQVDRRRDGSPYPWQVILDEWNQDGTPVKPKK